jgi:hypothetical protein
MDKVRKPNISVCYTPSSEPYSIYLNTCVYQMPSLQFCILDGLDIQFIAYTILFSQSGGNFGLSTELSAE